MKTATRSRYSSKQFSTAKAWTFSLFLTLAGSGLAQAQYITNFDNFIPSSTLSGQIETDPVADQWASNDANQPDYVGELPGYSITTTDYWAMLGGAAVAPTFEPTETTVVLSKSVSFATVEEANNVLFSTTMAISSSTPSRPDQDTFQWKFMTAGGADIVSLDFVPNGSVVQFKWTDYNGTQTATPNGIGYNTQFDLFVSIGDLDGTPTFVVTVDPVGIDPAVTIINTSLSTLTPEEVGQFAATWTLADTAGGSPYANYGYNAILFDNVALVPEPSIAGLAAIGGLLMMVRRRRANR